MSSALRVLFLAAEADPFFKVGGLGDVAGSLPPVLRQMGVDIRLVLPLHGGIRLRGYPLEPVCNLQVSALKGAMTVEVFALEQSALPVYFIAGELISSESPVYTTDTLADGLKYTFFSLAALELCRYLDWSPDILHANDWHTAPAVYSLSIERKEEPYFLCHRLGAGRAQPALSRVWERRLPWVTLGCRHPIRRACRSGRASFRCPWDS